VPRRTPEADTIIAEQKLTLRAGRGRPPQVVSRQRNAHDWFLSELGDSLSLQVRIADTATANLASAKATRPGNELPS
jgi:hypothetical protein